MDPIAALIVRLRKVSVRAISCRSVSPRNIPEFPRPSGTETYVASAGLPPAFGAIIAIIVEVVLGAALLVGWQARWVAPFTIGAAIFFHNFWASPPDQQLMQNIHFFKNMAIAGGLLFVFAFGPGAYSLDARSGRA